MRRKKSEIAGQRQSENQRERARAETTAGGVVKTRAQVPSSPPPSNEIAGQGCCENQGKDARAETTAGIAVKTRAQVPSSPPSNEIAGQVSLENHAKDARAETTAGSSVKTKERLPSSPPSNEIAGQATIENHQKDARAETTAGIAVKTRAQVPSSPPPSNEIAGQKRYENHRNRAREAAQERPKRPPAPPDILQLIDLQRQRIRAIRMQSVNDRSADSHSAHYLGYHPGMPEEEGKALFKRVAAWRKSVEKQWKTEQKAKGHLVLEDQMDDAIAHNLDGSFDEREDQEIPSACLPIILNAIISRQCWDAMRIGSEKRMREIAGSLAVWPRCAQVEGFAELGLAVIVAEAGNDLTAFPHHMHLWKRLGLAPYKGKAMSTYHGPALTDEEWKKLGYDKHRLARIVGVVGTPLWLYKHKNDYGAVYAARREHTALTHPEDWTKAHSDNDAKRFMLKRFLAHLWLWWQECAGSSVAPSSVVLRDAAD